MGRYKKWIICTVVFFVLFTIIGFFVVPPIAKHYILEALSRELNRQVSLEQVSVNPYTLTVTLRGLEIKEPKSDKPFVSVGEFVVNLNFRSLLKRIPVIELLTVRKPYVHVVRNDNKTYNFSDLLAKMKEEEPKEEKPLPLFSVNNIVIESGSVDFVDSLFETTHTVREMNLAIPFLSSVPEYVDSFVEPRFAAVINGAPYSLEGKTKVFKDTRETIFNIVIEDLDLPFYLAYLPPEINISIPSGKLDVQSTITFSLTPQQAPLLKLAGNVALREFSLQDRKKNPIAALKRLDVFMTALEPLQSKFHFAKIALDSPELNVLRDKSGTINLLNLAPPKKEEPQPAKAEAKTEEKPLPTLILEEFDLKAGKIAYRDEVPQEPVNSLIQEIHVKGEKISTIKDSQGKLSLSMDFNKGQGSLAMAGPVSLNPLFANLDVDLKRARIRPFQEYFTEYFRVNFTSGAVSSKGTLSVSQAPGKEVSATYAGNLLLARVATVDKVLGEDFMKFKSLFLNGMSLGYNPLFVRIKDISLADFFVRISLDEEGNLNLMNVAKPEAAGQEEAAGPIPEPAKKEDEEQTGEKKEYLADILAKNIAINRITLQGGTIEFDDRYVKPSYTTTLTEIGGRVNGVTSITTKAADVELRGKMGKVIPIEIVGKVHPFKENLFVDLKASTKDFNLSPLSPYSGKYIGYKIQKGSLSFDVKYHIVKKSIDLENRVLIDQLTLGEKVESPEATNLPVSLAITLLKDREGKIVLDIPVTGQTDDPEFSVFRIVLQIIVNLITKIVTAPFALIGSLFGGGEELAYIEFDYGSDRVPESGVKKIETITQALKEKPALSLDIEGHVDLERDREGLKQFLVQRKVKAQKLNTLIRQGKKVLPVDEITVEPAEYERYLTLAYKAEKFPKPKNFIGLEKSLPVEEMEKLMLTNTAVKDDDLRLLAMRRAQKVEELFLGDEEISSERIFVNEPTTLQPEEKKDVKQSRVDFKLK